MTNVSLPVLSLTGVMVCHGLLLGWLLHYEANINKQCLERLPDHLRKKQPGKVYDNVTCDFQAVPRPLLLATHSVGTDPVNSSSRHGVVYTPAFWPTRRLGDEVRPS